MVSEIHADFSSKKKKEFWYCARYIQVSKVTLSKIDGRYRLVKEKLQYQIYQKNIYMYLPWHTKPFDATMVRATRTSKQRICLIRKTTTLHVQHTFLYTSMTSRHDYDVKMPNFTLYGGLKQTKKFSFSFWTWIWFLRISTSGEFAYIWQSKGVIRIIAKKIERTRIHFLSDVFAAIAVLGSSVTVHNILQGR